jgi:phytoene dehydrogenase-like protein
VVLESYKRYEGPDAYDAIIVGSGIGGLGTASLLGRHRGWRVLVLERHYMAGGFTHTFRRPGYEWDVGVHYVGDVHNETSSLRAMFDGVMAEPVEWADMGRVYDTLRIGERTYKYVAGRENWRQQMREYFPSETGIIDQYLKLIEATVHSSKLYYVEKVVPSFIAAGFGWAMRARFLRRAGRTTREVLESLTANQEMIAVLTGLWGDYGLPPALSSFGVHAIVATHYLNGGAYPVGGAGRIAGAIVPAIEARGGRVLVSAEVAEILVERGRATGVRMADGKVFRAPLVVSDTGVANTVRLLPAAALGRDALAYAARRIGPSTAHACLYVGLKRDDADLGLERSNIWVYPSPDFEGDLAGFANDPEAPLPFVYISFPSAKDPSFTKRYPGRATVEVITAAPYEWFRRWEDRQWKKRGEEYATFKARLAERLLEALYRAVPPVRGEVDVFELSTPITTRHFVSHPHGEMYGLAHTPQRFRERLLKPRTAIRGLYLTGQDISVCGLAGALAGAYVTASAIVGRPLFPRKPK